MKFLKILAAVLAVCLLSCAFVACDSGKGEETGSATEAATKFTANVTLVIMDGDKQVDEEKVPYVGDDATLKSVIEFYCALEDYKAEECFDTNGLLVKIGNLQGNWEAYDKAAGSNNKIQSIKDFQVTDGMTVVLTCTK